MPKKTAVEETPKELVGANVEETLPIPLTRVKLDQLPKDLSPTVQVAIPTVASEGTDTSIYDPSIIYVEIDLKTKQITYVTDNWHSWHVWASNPSPISAESDFAYPFPGIDSKRPIRLSRCVWLEEDEAWEAETDPLKLSKAAQAQVDKLAQVIVECIQRLSKVAVPQSWQPQKKTKWSITATQTIDATIVIEADTQEEAEEKASQFEVWKDANWRYEKMRDWSISEAEAVDEKDED